MATEAPAQANGLGPVPLDEIRVEGSTQLEQLGLFNLGGKAPTSASIALTGGRVLLVDGQAFQKGEVIRFTGTAVVHAVAQQDAIDSKTGQVVSAEQKHWARVSDLVIESVRAS